ncbi:hypothetical protein JCM8547_001156 [Rhodosporidiobolus lusitaniae]
MATQNLSLDLRELGDTLYIPSSSSSLPAPLSTLPPELKLKIVDEVAREVETSTGVRPLPRELPTKQMRLNGSGCPTSLANLSAVNKDFRETCTPHLWEEVDLVKHSCESTLFFLDHILPVQAATVKRLILGGYSNDELPLHLELLVEEREQRKKAVLVAAKQRLCPRPDQPLVTEATGAKDLLLSAVVQKCTALRSVELSSFLKQGDQFCSTFAALSNRSKSLERLQVAVNPDSLAHMTVLEPIGLNYPSLSHLAVHFQHGSYLPKGTRRPLDLLRTSLTSFRHLKRLQLKNVAAFVVRRLEGLLPKLEQLDLDILDLIDLSLIHAFLQSLSTSLRILNLRHGPVREDKLDEALSLPRLERLSLHSSRSPILPAILSGSPSLRVIGVLEKRLDEGELRRVCQAKGVKFVFFG